MITQICTQPAGTSAPSLFEAAYHEARRHQWLESQFARRDLGDAAFYDWYRRYWTTFLRYRHIEHLIGEQIWSEFNQKSFGILRDGYEQNALTYEVIEQYRSGKENFNIIWWAQGNGHCADTVRQCLLQINMNGIRLHPRLD